MGDVFYGSYSQLSTYGECSRRYELEKIARVPRRPGFWFPGGTAVHATIEAYLREAVKCQDNSAAASPAANSSSRTTTGNSSTPNPTSTDATPTSEGTSTPSRPDFPVEEVFQLAFMDAFEAEINGTTFPPEEWFTAGRGKGEDLDWWVLNGGVLAQNYIDWYESSQDIHIWTAPDGRPAIELDLDVPFGDVRVRMVIDQVLQVGYGPTAPLIVTDIKSGSTKPRSPKQLGIYASGLEATYGVRPRYGAYFMCRGTGKEETIYLQQPVELSAAQYSMEYLAAQFEQFRGGVQGKVFLANPGENCRRCGVAYACTEQHGEDAPRLDPNYPHPLRKGH